MNAIGQGSGPVRTTRSWWRRQRINLLRLAAALFLPLCVMAQPVIVPGTLGYALIDMTGIVLVIAGVLGRFWSIAYIGGRKQTCVLQDGPYSICRHPLYLFSTLASVGFGLMLGSLVLALLIGGITFVILSRTAAHEEIYLRGEFGSAYDDYAARVPRILPDLALWRSEPFVNVNLSSLRGNFHDALVFLGFIPLTRLLVWLRETYDLGLYPVF